MDWRRNTGQRTETEALDFNELESLKNRPAATKLLSFTTKKKKILISPCKTHDFDRHFGGVWVARNLDVT